MVLIISEEGDRSTSDVIEWLLSFNIPFLRINGFEYISLIDFELSSRKSEFVFEYKGTRYSTENITGYWFRRGGLKIRTEEYLGALSGSVSEDVLEHLKLEKDILLQALYKILEGKNAIGSPLTDRANKLTYLLKAKEIGLSVPDTYITSQKATLEGLLSKEQIITKGIQRVACFNLGESLIGNYTEEVQAADMLELEDSIFPSLVQTKILKKYELRIFYLRGNFYTMAIFSQNDPQTSVDFRKYNFTKPNRNVPYALPEVIKDKLTLLMEHFNLKTGSIDMVVSAAGEFVFLEVNPIGQFGMVSSPCNYNLEKEIACQLSYETN